MSSLAKSWNVDSKSSIVTRTDYIVQCSVCRVMFYKSLKSCPTCTQRAKQIDSSYSFNILYDDVDYDSDESIDLPETEMISVDSCKVVMEDHSSVLKVHSDDMMVESIDTDVVMKPEKKDKRHKLHFVKRGVYHGESAYFKLFDGTNRVYKKDGSHPKEYETILSVLGLETNLQVVVDEHNKIVGTFSDLNAVSYIVNDRVERIHRFYDDKPKPNEIARVCKIVIWTFMNLFHFRHNKQIHEMPHASGDVGDEYTVVNGKAKKHYSKSTTFEDDMAFFVKQCKNVLHLQKKYSDVVSKDRNLQNKFMLITRFLKYFGH